MRIVSSLLFGLSLLLSGCSEVTPDTGGTDGGSSGSDGCVVSCEGRACGDDGCGGTCGSCPSDLFCSGGACVSECTPSCAGRECGDDGCGGDCGPCSDGLSCLDGACTGCTPSCGARNCGNDGCGGSCGACGPTETCNSSGTCVCSPSCGTRNCGDDGCGGSCGTCTLPEVCNSSGQCACTPSCGGRNCGANGCGGSCGTCTAPDTCRSGVCSCIPTTWYRDSDGDGYPTSSTMSACARPSGYIAARSDGLLDCADTVAQANPGAVGWYTSGYCIAGVPPRCTRSYDYDCSGTVEQRYPQTGGCVLLSPSGCLPRAGWVGGSVPNCSVFQMFVTGCDSRCMPITTIRQQSCH